MSLLILASMFILGLCALRTLWSDWRYRSVRALDIFGCFFGFFVLIGSMIAWSDAVLILIIALSFGGLIALIQTARRAWVAPVDGMMLVWFIMIMGGTRVHGIVSHIQSHIHKFMHGPLRIPTQQVHHISTLLNFKSTYILGSMHVLRLSVFLIVLGVLLVLYHTISRQVKAPFLTCAWISFFLCQVGIYFGILP